MSTSAWPGEIPAVPYAVRRQPGRTTVDIGPQAGRLLGFPSEEWIRDPDFWSRRLHPEDRDRASAEFARAAEARRTFQMEYRLLARDDRTVWVLDTAAPSGDDLMAGLLLDVTDRRAAEGKILQNHKLEALGRLAASVAHDFNNILTVVIGYGELLLTGLAPEHEMRSSLTEILEAGRRGGKLTRQLLDFGRREDLRFEPVDLNAVVSAMLPSLSRLIGNSVILTFTPHKDPCPILGDRPRIEDAIRNLAQNARDAMPAGGRLQITTSALDLDDNYLRTEPRATLGPHVLLTISDNGVGMTSEIRSRLFEPFFTTKGRGRGMGLGLACVYSTVSQHRGHIRVHSQLGQGSTFHLYFPRESGVSRARTVLIVDDEAEVRALVTTVLKEEGYHVLEASDGGAAVRIFALHEGPIDLVISDTTMPGPSGVELAQRLQQLRPGTKLVLLSGNPEAPPGFPLISKPFVRADFVRTIAQFLSRPGI